MDSSDTPKLERLPSVQSRVPYSRARIYQLVKDGKFPAPVRLGGRASAWLSSEIDEWIARRVAERDGNRATSRVDAA